ncbi:glycosyltransferase [Vibrio splendidus]
MNYSESNRAKVLVVTTELISTGPNHVIFNLLQEMIADKVNVCVVGLRTSKDSVFVDKIISLGVEVHQLKTNFPILELNKIIRNLRPNIVNTHGIKPDLYVGILGKINKFIQFATIHNVPSEDYIFRYGKIVGNLMVYAHSLVFNSKIIGKICVSKNIEKNLIHRGAKNTFTVYNGVDDKVYNIVNRVSRTVKQVVFCGQLVDLKDPQTIITVAKRFPEVEFAILGDGPLKSSLFNIAPNNVTLYGNVDNVQGYFSKSDILLMPSKTEGMPMVLLEGLFCGLDAITTDITIFKEIANIEGVNIHQYKIKNIDSLEIVLRNVLYNKVEKTDLDMLGKKLSSKAMCKKYIKIFNKRNDENNICNR